MRKFISIFSVIFLLLSSILLSNIFAKEGKGGHYEGGTGSSHKGGHYVNPSTNNHYSNYGTGKGESSEGSGGGGNSSNRGNGTSQGYYGSSGSSSGIKSRYQPSEFKPFYDQYRKPAEIHSGVKRDDKGRIIRSESAKEEFLRMKGFKEVPSGYQVDHIVPLYAGGRDDPSNMQLLTTQEHKTKTKADYNKY